MCTAALRRPHLQGVLRPRRYSHAHLGVPWLGQSLENVLAVARVRYLAQELHALRGGLVQLAPGVFYARARLAACSRSGAAGRGPRRLAGASTRMLHRTRPLRCCLAGAVSGASASPPDSPNTFSLEREEPGLSAAVYYKGAPKAVAAASVSLFDATTRPCSPASAP